MGCASFYKNSFCLSYSVIYISKTYPLMCLHECEPRMNIMSKHMKTLPCQMYVNIKKRVCGVCSNICQCQHMWMLQAYPWYCFNMKVFYWPTDLLTLANKRCKFVSDYLGSWALVRTLGPCCPPFSQLDNSWIQSLDLALERGARERTRKTRYVFLQMCTCFWTCIFIQCFYLV